MSEVEIVDTGRIRTIRFRRPEAKNAMNEVMWHATATALREAAVAPGIAVVVLTGSEDSFSAGQDVMEMAQIASGELEGGGKGFQLVADALLEFPKPLLCAVNGLALGFGVTVLGYADLVFMSTTARLKCPFTSLGVAPELASSYLFPRLMGQQNAAWVLLSSEWIPASQAKELGLAWKLCEPDALMATTMEHAEILATKPISSLVESKRVMMEPIRAQIAAARTEENAAFATLMGGPANIESMMAFAEKRPADFSKIND